jgi:hypothetical protein
MTRNNNRSRRTGNKSQRNNLEHQQVQLLKQLVAFRRQEIDLPAVPDVVPLALRPNKVYTFTRLSPPQNISSDPLVETDFGFRFTLDSLTSYSEFSNLFEEFRIIRVEAIYRTSNALIPLIGKILTCIDYDDSAALPLSALQQYQTAQVNSPREDFTRVIKPRVSLEVYQGATSGYTSTPNIWLDSSNPSIAHFGFKLSLPAQVSGASATPTLQGTIMFRYYIQCRNPH